MSGPGLTRRTTLALGAAAALVGPRGVAFGGEGDVPRSHGLAAFNDLVLPADFKHFGYANPNAPKGGRFSYTPSSWGLNQNPNTFNSLNTLILKGDAPVGLTGIFATLMVRALDEPDALYGLVAESVAIEDGGKIYRFFLRSEATFHDGSPLTAEDVAFSFNILKAEGHPVLSLELSQMEGAEARGPHELVVRFTGKQARDTPLTVAGLPIISKAYYSKRPFNETTMDPPLGSGPYKVGRLETGRYIEYERVRDWWAEKLPVNVGQNNFDVIRVEFFRDRQVGFEGFKSGTYLFREEFTSRTWATSYDFPALREGRVVRETFSDDRPSGMQGWFINTRRPKFADLRVREALINAFDFEWTNKTYMYDSYKRTSSVFENSEWEAQGKPSPEELALLEPLRGVAPDEVFGEPFNPPVSDGSGQDRRLLRRAAELLRQAGWQVRDGVLKNAAGEPFTLEIIDESRTFEPHALAYVKNLKILGIDANFRLVDAAQEQAREKEFDFDLFPRRFSFDTTPGESLRQFFGSKSAGVQGSQNLPGVADKAVDALIERAIGAKSRVELAVACRALDRALRAGRYWIPHWYKGTHWVATWDAFGRPETKPKYGFPYASTWWWDAAKAARAGVAG